MTVQILFPPKIYIIPGLASVPFHVFIVVSFGRLHYNPEYHKKKPPIRTLMLSLASLLYVALNVLPSAVLFTDLACPCETEDCMGETSACKISRFTIFILMMMLYSLLTQVVRLTVEINEKIKAIRPVRLYAQYGDRINW